MYQHVLMLHIFLVSCFAVFDISYAHVPNNRQPNYTICFTCDNLSWPWNSTSQSHYNRSHVLLSAANVVAYIGDHWQLVEKYPKTSAAALIALMHCFRASDWYTGHCLQAQAFGCTIKRSYFGNDLLRTLHEFLPMLNVGMEYYDMDDKLSYQQYAMLQVAGYSANSLLAQRAMEQWLAAPDLEHPDLLRGLLCILTTMKAVECKYSPQYFEGYLESMHAMYGQEDGLLSYRREIELGCLLELISSLCSQTQYITNFNLPYAGNLAMLVPKIEFILTSYGVIEKRCTLYGMLKNSALKFVLGIGQERGKEKVGPAARDGVVRRDNGQNNYTFYTELSVYRAFHIGRSTIGFSMMGWRQPELFTDEPKEAPIKHGGMALVKWIYPIQGQWNGFVEFGYKTAGFVTGHPTGKTHVIRGGINAMLA